MSRTLWGSALTVFHSKSHIWIVVIWLTNDEGMPKSCTVWYQKNRNNLPSRTVLLLFRSDHWMQRRQRLFIAAWSETLRTVSYTSNFWRTIYVIHTIVNIVSGLRHGMDFFDGGMTSTFRWSFHTSSNENCTTVLTGSGWIQRYQNTHLQ